MTQDGGGTGVHLQDDLFLRAKRDGRVVTIFLLGGVRLTGRVRGYDKFTVLLEARDHEQLIYKHAISTVSFSRVDGRRAEGPAHPAQRIEEGDGSEPGSDSTASS